MSPQEFVTSEHLSAEGSDRATARHWYALIPSNCSATCLQREVGVEVAPGIVQVVGLFFLEGVHSGHDYTIDGFHLMDCNGTMSENRAHT